MIRHSVLYKIAAWLCIGALLLPFCLHSVCATAEGAVTVTFDNPVDLQGGVTITADGLGDSQYTFTTAGGESVVEIERYVYFQISNETLRNAAAVTVSITLCQSLSAPPVKAVEDEEPVEWDAAEISPEDLVAGFEESSEE